MYRYIIIIYETIHVSWKVLAVVVKVRKIHQEGELILFNQLHAVSFCR